MFVEKNLDDLTALQSIKEYELGRKLMKVMVETRDGHIFTTFGPTKGHTLERNILCVMFVTKVFVILATLHTMLEKKLEKKLHKCDVCDKSFSKPYNLVVHARIPFGEKLYECDVCKERFTQLSFLENHNLLKQA